VRGPILRVSLPVPVVSEADQERGLVMADTTNQVSEAGLAEYLQDLVLNSSDVEEFLGELARYSAARLAQPGRTIYCGITLVRRKRSVTLASSDAKARVLDELQNTFGDGPCLTAIRDNESVLVPDVDADRRWREYMAVWPNTACALSSQSRSTSMGKAKRR
jgi:putative methionine-R-sulfoxide reductase with GAF domain